MTGDDHVSDGAACGQFVAQVLIDAFFCHIAQLGLVKRENLIIFQRRTEIARCRRRRCGSDRGRRYRGRGDKGGCRHLGNRRRQFAIATGDRIGWRPVTGAPAQAVGVANNGVACILRVGAVWFGGLYIGYRLRRNAACKRANHDAYGKFVQHMDPFVIETQ